MPVDYDPSDPENRLGRYILDDAGNPVPEPDLFKWARWFETGNRVVARDEIEGHRVSTVFLAIDHSYRAAGLDLDNEGPILFETMVFNDYGSLDQDWAYGRYRTRAEALEGHAAIVTELRLFLASAPSAPSERP